MIQFLPVAPIAPSVSPPPYFFVLQKNEKTSDSHLTNVDCMLNCEPVAADSGCVAGKNFWESLESGLTKQKMVLNYRPMRFAGELRNEPERSGAQKKFWKKLRKSLDKTKNGTKL